jgi:hypothetical protein
MSNSYKTIQEKQEYLEKIRKNKYMVGDMLQRAQLLVRS